MSTSPSPSQTKCTSQSCSSNSSSLPNFSSSPLTYYTDSKLNSVFNAKYTTYYTVIHLPTSIVSSIFNPLVPHAPQTVFVWLILNSLLDSKSPIDLFVMLHLLFGTNYPPSFIPSPQKQLMPTQCHSHHLPYLINNFLSISRHLFTLSFPL